MYLYYKNEAMLEYYLVRLKYQRYLIKRILNMQNIPDQDS